MRPSKSLKTLVFLLLFACSGISLKAQSDTSIAIQRALIYADSLVHAFRNNNWNDYISLSYPGVVRYYGGKQGFQQYVERARSVTNGIIEEPREKVEVVQIATDQIREWQCVVRKTRQTMIDSKKATIVSYLVGQSKDEGKNWKFFDVAYNSVENVIYIMPDIFSTLAIPQRQIVFEKDQLVIQK